MGILTVFNQVDKAPETLESLLLAIARHGEPTLTKGKYGWWCYIDMHVSSKGASFSIKSESSHGTPMAAARQCFDRIGSTLADLGA